MGIVTRRPIQPGEEILLDYGDKYWEAIRSNLEIEAGEAASSHQPSKQREMAAESASGIPRAVKCRHRVAMEPDSPQPSRAPPARQRAMKSTGDPFDSATGNGSDADASVGDDDDDDDDDDGAVDDDDDDDDDGVVGGGH